MNNYSVIKQTLHFEHANGLTYILCSNDKWVEIGLFDSTLAGDVNGKNFLMYSTVDISNYSDQIS